MVFVGLTKTFDIVNSEAFWKILSKAGLPEKMIKVLISLHKGMMATVISNSQCSETFSVATGTKQDCVVAAVLFSMFFSVMLQRTFWDYPGGVKFQFHTDEDLLNLKGQCFRSKKTNQGRNPV
ncbi:uncharacterized protein LOC115216246 [Octopus sinensis]|uniref:Uncharacterized protein LOC115216246 n=1 Tax=Octopus sinensis TaxID=2607531 RepID=A0A6P7SSV4_9MOLL|nr:uncharacterized protein LOC115216246 [Octopus sinensis]